MIPERLPRKPIRPVVPGRAVAWFLAMALISVARGAAKSAPPLQNAALSVEISAENGSYALRAADLKEPVLRARVGAEVDHHWRWSTDYPRHQVSESGFEDSLGSGQQAVVVFTGLNSQPDLVYVVRLYRDRAYGTVQVKVVNHTSNAVEVQKVRVVDATGRPALNLGGLDTLDRVMMESFSEDPSIKIGGLDQAPNGTYFGVQDGLVYNRGSRQSWFAGALSSHRFLTVLHLGVSKPPMGSATISKFTVDSSGTTEAVLQRDKIVPAQQVELSLPIAPGKSLDSERVMFAAGPDYHAQLEAYGAAVRQLHQARVSSAAPMGWWSWSAFYEGINQSAALVNAHWLAQHLKQFGYNYLHIDEGYDYARGEYARVNAAQFPDGMEYLGRKLADLGLKLGLWTAPFEVSARAWVYQHHKDWLVHDAHGQPIQIGSMRREGPLFVLDTTHPGAQAYLRQTYRTLTRQWGASYIKLDFMDSSAIEGYYYRPHTTALEAQRLGLRIIRRAVGDHVLLDKDGSPMLNPVGLVDEGRISVDTAHTFEASKNAATNIAVRYYMNRNFYVSDPDAFNLSTQIFPQPDRPAPRPLTLNEAQVQIVLAAVAGGMFEIGDNLPVLAEDQKRLALVRNPDLLRMVKLGRPSVPMDLMTYPFGDQIPSVFLLRIGRRESMLAVFNWTEQPRTHRFQGADLGLPEGHVCKAYDSLDGDKPVALDDGRLILRAQPPHSVRLIKLLDITLPVAASPGSARVRGSHDFSGR